MFFCINIIIRSVQVCYFELNLTFSLGAPFSREAFRFTQTPGETLHVTEGSDAALKWDYSAVNKEADLRRIKWSVYNKTEDDYYPLVVEYPNGTVKLNSAIPPEYDGRIKKEGRATFVIKGVSFEHSNRFKCTLEGKQGVAEIWSTTELVVTGAVCFIK